jgi:hypothetical protein
MTNSWGRLVRGINTMGVEGTYLEDVSETTPGYALGVAVIVKNINETFLMRNHDTLSDEEIWDMAKILMKEKGIKIPEIEKEGPIEPRTLD